MKHYQLIAPVEKKFERLSENIYIGIDDDTLSSKAAELLIQNKFDDCGSGKFNSWILHGGIG